MFGAYASVQLNAAKGKTSETLPTLNMVLLRVSICCLGIWTWELCLKWAETAKEQKKGLHWATKTGSMGKEEILYDWIRSGSFCIQFGFLYITPVDTNCYSKAFFNGKNPITLTKRQKTQMNPDERDQLRWGKSKRDEKITHLWYERMRIT